MEEGLKQSLLHSLPLSTAKPLPQTTFNRVFAPIYSCGLLALFYHHVISLFHSTTLVSFSVTIVLLMSDLVLAFMWVNTQVFRLCPIQREEYPENLQRVIKRSDFPAMDVFICTADPYREPPIGVVNTALSVMAYDFPREKLSVYVSDDGGSALTLFAFMEAAKFATHWLPFCENNHLMERCPEAYFQSDGHARSPEAEKIKKMYESMKAKVEHVLEKGRVVDQYITEDRQRESFKKWTAKFTKQDHPAVIEVLLDASKDKDVDGQLMPNLIYVTRGKSKTSPHQFKAGALNALLRVSASITNAPVILTLDCDMYSNDPKTPLRVMCYLCDPAMQSNLAYLQFPQRFQGVNKNDIYAGEYQRLYQIQPMGFDGLLGPNYLGSGCFFRRRSFFGGPTTPVTPEKPELGPDHLVDKPIHSREILELAHEVAGCNYENHTNWGSKIGFRYGSLSEDLHTGYHMKCQGWRSAFRSPERAAFLGDAPMTLLDMLNQQKRWSMGLLQVGFSKYNPITFGARFMGPLMGLAYANYSYWPLWSIPIITYALLPQLALLNKVSIFPKVSDPLFLLYVFLFLGAYGQDFLDFIIDGGTFRKWWNDQRIWLIRGVTCLLFGSLEFFLKSLGISAFSFNVTSKILDHEQGKRYEQGVFEFGVHSPMYATLTLVAIINLMAFFQGFIAVFGGNEGLVGQMALAGFAVVNCWPVYEAMILRSDKGKIPIKTTLISILIASALYIASGLILK